MKTVKPAPQDWHACMDPADLGFKMAPSMTKLRLQCDTGQPLARRTGVEQTLACSLVIEEAKTGVSTLHISQGQGKEGSGRVGQGMAAEGRARWDEAGQQRAGQDEAGQSRTGQGKMGQDKAEKGNMERDRAWQGRAGQAGQGKMRQNRAWRGNQVRAGRAGQASGLTGE